MKKLIALILTLSLLLAMATGCSSHSTDSSEDTLKIVTTIFPEYDWVREILGDNLDNVELTLLLNDGVDVHSYQATTDDIITISDCDVFIYVGGESDSWVEDALEVATNPDMVVINLLDVLGSDALDEEYVEGMEGEDHDHDHDEDEDEDEDHDHDDEEAETDEHVWLSLNNAKTFVSYIANVLGEIDAANADDYTANAESYNLALTDLDNEYTQMVAKASRDTILVADRFPFQYLVKDYGISYYAAFVGCSAETEASFETIVFLAEKTDELDLSVILKVSTSDDSIAQTVIESSTAQDQEILSLNSLESVTNAEIESGVTYFSIMEENLEILKSALE